MDLEQYPHERRESWASKHKIKLLIGGLAIFAIIVLVAVVSFAIFADGSSDMDMDDMDDMHNMDDMDMSVTPTPTTQRRPNIIFMISDGFSPSSETFARTMNPEQPLLELDTMIVGTSRTFSSSSLITDSAAGATAYACGHKTYNGAIAVDPDQKPIGTAMEAAKRQNMTTAIVTTSRITHATPASFSSHTTWRDLEEDIALQQATQQNVDLLFGGGLNKFIHREDNQNLLDIMQGRNYQTLTTYDEFLNEAITLPTIGLFAPEHLDYEIDRIRSDPINQPSLPEMVSKALNALKQNDNPFFLMIEGARIDMAAHIHDAYSHYMEIDQYQAAVAVVKKFVDENPDTYVVSVADHGTGGLSIGSGFHNGTYPDPYAWYPEKLKNQTASVEWISNTMQAENDVTLSSLAELTDRYCGIELTEDEFKFINHSFTVWTNQWSGLSTALGTVISNRALIAWTTPGHVGVDVNLYAYGKRAAGFGGVMNNIDVGNFIWEEMGFIDDMNTISAELQETMVLPPYPPTKAGKQVYMGHN